MAFRPLHLTNLSSAYAGFYPVGGGGGGGRGGGEASTPKKIPTAIQITME